MHNKITTTMGHFQNIAGKVETVIVRNGARRQYNIIRESQQGPLSARVSRSPVSRSSTSIHANRGIALGRLGVGSWVGRVA